LKIGGTRQRLKICDDLAGLVDETLESNTLPSGDEESSAVVVGV
jgi:hypothetical protein